MFAQFRRAETRFKAPVTNAELDTVGIRLQRQMASRSVMEKASENARSPAVRDILAGDQDGRPRRARTDVLSRRDPHAMLKIAGLLPVDLMGAEVSVPVLGQLVGSAGPGGGWLAGWS